MVFDLNDWRFLKDVNAAVCQAFGDAASEIQRVDGAAVAIEDAAPEVSGASFVGHFIGIQDARAGVAKSFAYPLVLVDQRS
ncbi:hypothetical protein D3C85_1564180 [compost metagenome]